MKIDGPAPPRPSAGAQRARSRGGASGGFRVDLGGDEAPASGVSSAAPPLAIASLLSLQEAPTATEGRSRGLRRGRDLLEQLDRIHLALLTGQVPISRLDGMMRSLQQARGETGDPRLTQLLDEIELRCAVELAKFEALRGAAPNAA